MEKLWKKIVVSLITIGVTLSATSALASSQKHGLNGFRSDYLFDLNDKERWIVCAGTVAVLPYEGPSMSPIGGTVDIGDQFVPELDFIYFFTKNVTAEVILGT